MNYSIELTNEQKKQLKENPELLNEAIQFTSIATQYELVSSQALDTVAKGINKVANTNLAFEGSKQYARDINVFKQLNEDAFKNSKVFANAKNAQNYYDFAESYYNGSNKQTYLKNLERKLNGTAQEVDWIRDRKGALSRIFNKTKLIGNEQANAPGIDGVTTNRVTGKITGVSVKTANGNKGLVTNAKDVIKAIDNNTLKPTDEVVGTKGMKEAVNKYLDKAIQQATDNGDKQRIEKLKITKEKLKIKELGTKNKTKESTNRLMNKMKDGKATPSATIKGVGKQMKQGALIGAAVNVSISSVKGYLDYKNGKITKEEAFINIGKEGAKGAIIGGAMAGISVFIPGGPIGFLAGMAIGIYIGKLTQNILDEVFGQGSFKSILKSYGYIQGNIIKLSELLEVIKQNEKIIEDNHKEIRRRNSNINTKNENIKNILGDL